MLIDFIWKKIQTFVALRCFKTLGILSRMLPKHKRCIDHLWVDGGKRSHATMLKWCGLVQRETRIGTTFVWPSKQGRLLFFSLLCNTKFNSIRPVRKHEYVITLEEYREHIKCGDFPESVTNFAVSSNWVTDVSIPNDLNNVPQWATHATWVSK